MWFVACVVYMFWVAAAAKVSFFLRSESGHEVKWFPTKKKKRATDWLTYVHHLFYLKLWFYQLEV